jgi:hypothetical protein
LRSSAVAVVALGVLNVLSLGAAGAVEITVLAGMGVVSSRTMMLRAGSGSAAFTKRSVRCAFILPSAPTEARSISTGKMLSVEGGVLGGNGLKGGGDIENESGPIRHWERLSRRLRLFRPSHVLAEII